MEKIDVYLTVEETAHLLKVPKSWLYRRTSKRQIPHRKVGRHIRFSRRELHCWLEEQRVEPQT